jgi:hypothetical protein
MIDGSDTRRLIAFKRNIDGALGERNKPLTPAHFPIHSCVLLQRYSLLSIPSTYDNEAAEGAWTLLVWFGRSSQRGTCQVKAQRQLWIIWKKG